uniref:DDE Tnp4 domain-containing protein n=1 Tax=Pelodiscus sinensis TaxID=13735 RepID=K7FKP1_PELSI
MRPVIPLQKRVAIALWKLSMLDSYRSLGNQFGMGKSTVGAVLMQVVKAINRVLLRRLVCLTDPDAVIQGLGALSFPNCREMIDKLHIPIRVPEHQASQYINHKGYFSVLLQGMSDHGGQFMDINVGWSGKAHNARVFCNSSMCQRLQAGTFFPNHQIRVGDMDMPICLVRDVSCPL